MAYLCVNCCDSKKRISQNWYWNSQLNQRKHWKQNNKVNVKTFPLTSNSRGECYSCCLHEKCIYRHFATQSFMTCSTSSITQIFTLFYFFFLLFNRIFIYLYLCIYIYIFILIFLAFTNITHQIDAIYAFQN